MEPFANRIDATIRYLLACQNKGSFEFAVAMSERFDENVSR